MAIDLAKALDADFGSDDSDSDSGSGIRLQEVQAPSIEEDIRSNESMDLVQILSLAKSIDIEKQLQRIDPTNRFSVPELSVLYPSIDSIRLELAKYADKFNVDYMELVAAVTSSSQSDEYLFLMNLSALPELISNEIVILHRYVAARYRPVFPELETLITNSVDYCKIVCKIGQDLSQIRLHEPFLKSIVSGEKLLAIVMSAIQQESAARELSEVNWTNLFDAASACVELGLFLNEVSDFVAEKLAKYAPNVSALVGQVVASQLLMSTGSLNQLALTPSCNLPSLGVRDLLSQQRARTTHIRLTGYLYHCPLIHNLPPEIIKQALRIVSGKTILAARIDVSRSSPGGELGAKYRLEVQEKLDKLLLPPDKTAPKALPVPQERKSKKRAGRRLRKMKERFNMSELRKAQNKMEFGKSERTITDSFGEEVGLGMSRELDGAKVNRNTDARLSKAMINRLQKQKEQESIDVVLSSAKRPTEVNSLPRKRPRII